MDKLTVGVALEVAIGIIQGNPVYGREGKLEPYRGRLVVHFERASEVRAQLIVSFDMKNEDDIKALVEVTWPSTHYKPNEARLAAKLHTELADLATLIQANLDGYQIWLRNPEPEGDNAA